MRYNTGLSVLPVDTQKYPLTAKHAFPRWNKPRTALPAGGNNKFGIRNAEFGIMERASRGIPKGSYKGEIAEIRFFTIDYSFEIYPRSGDNNSELRIPN